MRAQKVTKLRTEVRKVNRGLNKKNARISAIAAERDRLRIVAERALSHIQSTSCGKEPYRSNTIWLLKDALDNSEKESAK